MRPGGGVHRTDSEPPAPPSEGRVQGLHLCSRTRLGRGPEPLWAEAGPRAPNPSGESHLPGCCVHTGVGCAVTGVVLSGLCCAPHRAPPTMPIHPGALPHWAPPRQLSCEEQSPWETQKPGVPGDSCGSQGEELRWAGAPGFSRTLSILGPDRCLSHDSAVPKGTWTTTLCPLSCLGPFLLQAGCAQGSPEPGQPCTGLEATV